MKVERVREKDGKLELLVELSGAEVAEEIQRIAAFEIGKNGYEFDHESKVSPAEFIRDRLGNVEAAFVFDEGIMRHRASFALTAAKVDAIGTPVFRCIEHAEEGKPFEYHLVCVPVPEFELEDYGPVTITLPSYTVKTEEIDEEIQHMAEAAAISVTDDSHDVVRKGDKVELAMQTTMGGSKVKPLCTEGREYTTGALAMPDDFDDAIIGMKVGETKTFTFMGPDLAFNEDGSVKMDEYETTVTIKRILGSETPEMNDGWARTIMPGVKNMADLREKVAEKVAKRHEEDQQRQAELLASNELAKRFKGNISDLVYGVAVKEARENLNNRLKDQNQSLEQYLAKEGLTQEQLNQQIMMQVRNQLTRQFSLNAYAKHKKLAVNDNDLNLFFESIAPNQANLAHADFKRDGRMYAARCAALRLKASRLLVENAIIKRVGADS